MLLLIPMMVMVMMTTTMVIVLEMEMVIVLVIVSDRGHFAGLEKDVEDSRVDCCVCGKRLLDEEDLKSHMRNYHTQDIVESVRTASKDKRFNAAADEVLNGTDNSEDEDDDGPPSPLKKGVAAILAMKKMTRGAEKTAQAEKEKQERASKKIVYGSFNPG
jgi:hypothetical protein